MKDLVGIISKRSQRKIKHYTEAVPIFERFNVDKQIDAALRRQVWLPCGGYLVIEHSMTLGSLVAFLGLQAGVIGPILQLSQVLAELQQVLFDDGWRCPEDAALLERMAAYAEREVAAGERLSAITRHMLGLCSGRPGARRYRQWLSDSARRHQVGEQAEGPVSAGGLVRAAAALCAV